MFNSALNVSCAPGELASVSSLLKTPRTFIFIERINNSPRQLTLNVIGLCPSLQREGAVLISEKILVAEGELIMFTQIFTHGKYL